MSETLKPDEAPEDHAHCKPRPRKRKGPESKPPVDAYRSVSLWCGRSRFFDTNEGGRLQVDPGQVALSFHLKRNRDTTEGEPFPVDTASCFVRLVDEAGDVWEAESVFSLDVFIQNMINLGRTSWLVYFDDAEEWKGAFDEDGLMTGATGLLDDRFYRKLLVGDERIELQFIPVLRGIVWVILGPSCSADPCFLGAGRPSVAPENWSR
jgi:hypothetical protein